MNEKAYDQDTMTRQIHFEVLVWHNSGYSLAKGQRYDILMTLQ